MKFLSKTSPPLPFQNTSSGITLVELALVIVLIGILLGAGYISWSSLAEARRIAKTRSVLNQAKDCLIQRITLDHRYPTYTSSPDCSAADPTEDVDSCLCDLTDGWGRRIKFLEGLSTNGTGVQDLLVIDKPAQEQNAVDLSSNSQVTDTDGTVRQSMAFLLISYGSDGNPDHSSYGNRFPAESTLSATMDPAQPPNFNNNTDDLHILVTRNELQAVLSE